MSTLIRQRMDAIQDGKHLPLFFFQAANKNCGSDERKYDKDAVPAKPRSNHSLSRIHSFRREALVKLCVAYLLASDDPGLYTFRDNNPENFFERREA